MSGRLGGLALSKAMRWRLGFRGSCEFDARLLRDGRITRGRRTGRFGRFARLADVVLARGVGAEDGKTNHRNDGPRKQTLWEWTDTNSCLIEMDRLNAYHELDSI